MVKFVNTSKFLMPQSYMYTAVPNVLHYNPFGSQEALLLMVSMPRHVMQTRSYTARAGRFGFNGKEKESDATAENYDFGARIYDGRVGVFLSIDPKFKEQQSFSPYYFALNNPIRWIDLNGEKPGDTFETMDAAARDFGLLYNGKSIRIGRETGAKIYSFQKDGKTYYSYIRPRKGSKNMGPSLPHKIWWAKGKKIVADIHTHAEYTGFGDDYFSKAKYPERYGPMDKDQYEISGEIGYVVTPSGFLLKYDPAIHDENIEDDYIPLYSDMPRDVDSPKNKDNTNTVANRKHERLKQRKEKLAAKGKSESKRAKRIDRKLKRDYQDDGEN